MVAITVPPLLCAAVASALALAIFETGSFGELGLIWEQGTALNLALGISAPGSSPSGAPVGIDSLDGAQNYDQRIAGVRGFTRDNPTRAALAVRDMIKADAR